METFRAIADGLKAWKKSFLDFWLDRCPHCGGSDLYAWDDRRTFCNDCKKRV